MCPEPVLGWDLGGAHLKVAVADRQGRITVICQLGCPLWMGMQHFDDAALRALDITRGMAFDHAVTMTGELVDLFPTREDGVRRLVDVMCRHVPAQRLRVYAGRHGFLGPREAIGHSDQVASANWCATASLLARRLDAGLLVDVGSTTTDIVPFYDNQVQAAGFSDHERLINGELVYAGVVRTPVMAMARRVPVDGAWVPLMAEHFATAADVYRLLSRLTEHADKLPSADRGDKTSLASARRLARMVGCDLEGNRLEPWLATAAYLAECQLQRFQDACEKVLANTALPAGAPLVGAGVGRFLVRTLATRLRRPYVDFCTLIDAERIAGREDAADCAPAVAVACLAQLEAAA
ncbi:MAG: hydantoinase/oxoprolinase family protein [Gammaproteobacteria bacterium]|jgi:probable H4MPT-linked C1 transfer pathway protein